MSPGPPLSAQPAAPCSTAVTPGMVVCTGCTQGCTVGRHIAGWWVSLGVYRGYIAWYPPWVYTLCTLHGIHPMYTPWYTPYGTPLLVYTRYTLGTPLLVYTCYTLGTPTLGENVVNSAQSPILSLGECGQLCAESSSLLWENVVNSARSPSCFFGRMWSTLRRVLPVYLRECGQLCAESSRFFWEYWKKPLRKILPVLPNIVDISVSFCQF